MRAHEHCRDHGQPDHERQNNRLTARSVGCAAVASADALVLEDYNKGVLVSRVIESAIQVARSRNIPIIVDPKYRNFFSYRGATVFKPNRR